MEYLRTHSELTLPQEMVEPLEETRNELIFATEPVLSSLDLSIPRGSRHTPLVELDEIEVRFLLLMQNIKFKSTSDSERHTTAVQGLVFSAHFSQTDSHKFETRMCDYQRRRKYSLFLMHVMVIFSLPYFRVTGKFLVLALLFLSLVQMDLRRVGSFLVLMAACHHIFNVPLIILVRVALLSTAHVSLFSRMRQPRNMHLMKSSLLHQICTPSVVSYMLCTAKALRRLETTEV